MIDKKISSRIKKHELEKRLNELISKKNNLLKNLKEIESVINKEKNITDISDVLLNHYELNGLANYDLKIGLKTTLYSIKKLLTRINSEIDNSNELLKNIYVCPDCIGDGFQTTHYIERSLGTPTSTVNSAICQKCNGTGELK